MCAQVGLTNFGNEAATFGQHHSLARSLARPEGPPNIDTQDSEMQDHGCDGRRMLRWSWYMIARSRSLRRDREPFEFATATSKAPVALVLIQIRTFGREVGLATLHVRAEWGSKDPRWRCCEPEPPPCVWHML